MPDIVIGFIIGLLLGLLIGLIIQAAGKDNPTW